jgi:hypothetical protein
MRPAVVIAITLATAWPLAIAHAAPPEHEATPESDPSDGPRIWDEPGGFWLSLELIGPRGAQIDAARSLAQPPVIDALPRGGAPPPGELVGRVDTLAQALSWVDANSFAPLSQDDASTPIPGGQLYERHGLFLTALVVTGGAVSGTKSYPWPSAAVLPIPPGAQWRPASLAVARAPVFAAPGPRLPPASERYQVVHIEDSVWLLDTLDRCDDEGACLRWAQILIRRGDRFFGGWVLATQVVPDSAWVAGPGERRFALLPSHRTRAEVGFALLEQRGDRREAGVGLHHAHAGAAWPDAVVEVLGEALVVLLGGSDGVGGQPIFTRHISADPGPVPAP